MPEIDQSRVSLTLTKEQIVLLYQCSLKELNNLLTLVPPEQLTVLAFTADTLARLIQSLEFEG